MPGLRPNSVYHVFYKLERMYLLQTIGTVDNETRGTFAPNDHYDALEHPRPKKYASIKLPPYWYYSFQVKKKRKHKKLPGRIDKTVLSKMVSENWRNSDAETKAYCKILAKADAFLVRQREQLVNENYKGENEKMWCGEISKGHRKKISARYKTDCAAEKKEFKGKLPANVPGLQVVHAVNKQHSTGKIAINSIGSEHLNSKLTAARHMYCYDSSHDAAAAAHLRAVSILKGGASAVGRYAGNTSNDAVVASITAFGAPHTIDSAVASPSSSLSDVGTSVTASIVPEPKKRKRAREESGVLSSHKSMTGVVIEGASRCLSVASTTLAGVPMEILPKPSVAAVAIALDRIRARELKSKGGVVIGGATTGFGVASATVVRAPPTTNTGPSSELAPVGTMTMTTTTKIAPKPSVDVVANALNLLRAKDERRFGARKPIEGIVLEAKNSSVVASTTAAGAPPSTDTRVADSSSGLAHVEKIDKTNVPKPSVVAVAVAILNQMRAKGERCVESHKPIGGCGGEATNVLPRASAAIERLPPPTDTTTSTAASSSSVGHAGVMTPAIVPTAEEAATVTTPGAAAAPAAASSAMHTPTFDEEIQEHRLQSEKWEFHFLELENFIKLYGNSIVPQKYPSNPKLGIWVKNQMRLYKLNKLSEGSTKRLRQLGFQFELPSNDPDKRWEQFYLELVEYYEVHGDANVPQNYKLNPQLANWVTQQREERKDGELSEFRTSCLWQLDFQFEIKVHKHEKNESWEARYRELAQYVEQHRKLTKHAEQHMDTSISTMYKTNPECYRELARYVEQHGNTETPKSYESRPKLGKWVKLQRKYFMRGRLVDERKTLLQQLGIQF